MGRLDAVQAAHDRWQLMVEHAAIPGLVAIARAADTYRKAVAAADSYPGHEEYVEAEWVELQGAKDDAECALAAALAEFEAGP